MTKVLRTPDERFDNLPDYPFSPNYVEVNDENLGSLRVHYVDEGPRDGRVVIMMHGEPSWSYLYRKMIKQVADAGCRVLAPDLIGFGKSDKPGSADHYTYNGHVDWMDQWLTAMDVEGAVLFCQDWGGLIGLRLVAAHPEMFAGVVAGNTFLPTGGGKPSDAFAAWKQFSQTVPEFPTGGIIRGATVKDLDEGVEAAYDAPYPDESYKAGARIFPALVPVGDVTGGAVENKQAWEIFSKFEKPFLTCFSDQDPITGGLDKLFHKNIPGCSGQPHQTVKGGGHFLQEDVPDELSTIIIDFVATL
jgi:haloalkane dehalogenase